MYAIKVVNIFGNYGREYSGEEHQFIYNGVEYLPLETCIKCNYLISAGDIEVIER